MAQSGQKSFRLFFTVLLLLTTSQAFAGSSGTVSYSPLATDVPTLSGMMLIVLSLMLILAAFRSAKNKNPSANKLFISLIGVSVLALGSGSFQLANTLVAAPAPELSEPNGGDADIFQNQVNTLVNTSGITQQITGVDVSGIQCANYVGDGSVSGECVPSLQVNQGASCTVDCTAPQADLSVTKTDNIDPVEVNDTVTYTITVKNNGPGSAENVVVTDELRLTEVFFNGTGNLVFVEDCTPTVVPGGEDIVCELGALTPGQEVLIEMQVTPGSIGTITNTATVTSETADSNTGNNSTSETTTVEEPLIALFATKFRDDRIGTVSPSIDERLTGWEITLYDSNGNQIAQGTTETDGRVSLGSHPAGTYTWCETPQPGWENTVIEGSRDPAGLRRPCESSTVNDTISHLTINFWNYEIPVR